MSSESAEEEALALHQLLETHNWSEVEDFLLDPKARDILLEVDDEGCVPLHYAAFYGCPWNIVEEMIMLCPSSLSATTNSDYTPLDYVDFDGGDDNNMNGDPVYMANREKVVELLQSTEEEVVESLEDDMLTGNSSIDEEDFLFFKEHLLLEFKKCDVDGDGTVSEPEFRLYLQKFMDTRNMTPIPKKDVDSMLRAVDIDGNGTIDFDEFCQMLNMSSQLHEALAKQHWNVARRRIKLYPDECCLVDMLGQSPLHYAVFCHAPEEIILRLVVAFPGGLMKTRASDKLSPLEYAESIKDKLGDDYQTILDLLSLDCESVYENRDSLLARAEQLRQSVEAGANLETRRKQFGDIDLDNDGQISYKEFKKYLKAQASRRHLYVPSDEDVKELIAEVDTDRDGVISFDEFVAMMESDAKPLHEACAKSRWSAVRERLHTHPDECRFVDTYGQLPLHYAAFNGVTEDICIRMLCEYPEAVVTERYMDNRTPKDFADHKNAPEVIIDLLSLTPTQIIENHDNLVARADELFNRAINGTRENLTMSMRKHDVDGISKAIQGMETMGLKNDPATRMARNAVTMMKEEETKSRKEIEDAKVTAREKMALAAEEKAKLVSEKARLKANALMTKAVHHITDATNHTKIHNLEDEALKAKEKADQLRMQADKLSKGTKSIKDRLKREESKRRKAEQVARQAEEEKEMILKDKQRVEAEKHNLAKKLKETQCLNSTNLEMIESLKRELLLCNMESSKESEISALQSKQREVAIMEEEASKRREFARLAADNLMARVFVMKREQARKEEVAELEMEATRAHEQLLDAETEQTTYQEQIKTYEQDLEALLQEKEAQQQRQRDLQMQLEQAQENFHAEKEEMRKGYATELAKRRASMNSKLEKIQTQHRQEIETFQNAGAIQHSVTIERNSLDPLPTDLDGGAYVDVATSGKASQSGTFGDGKMVAELAIRGYRTSKTGFDGSGEYSHTCATNTPWWQVELLPSAQSVKKVSVFGRPGYGHRMNNMKVVLLDHNKNVIYQMTFQNPSDKEAFSVSFATSIENVKFIKITRGGTLKTTDERLINLNAVQVFAAVSINDFVNQKSEQTIMKLQQDQAKKLKALESNYEEKLKISSENNESALKLGLQLQEEVEEVKAKEAESRAKVEQAKAEALRAKKEALALKEQTIRLEREREEQARAASVAAQAASTAEARAKELAEEEERLRVQSHQSEEEIRKREEKFEQERQALKKGQDEAMRRRASIQGRLSKYQKEMNKEMGEMNTELARLESQLSAVEEEDEFNVGDKQERTMRKFLCSNAIVAARERVGVKNGAEELRQAFIAISGGGSGIASEEAPLEEKIEALRFYSQSLEILVDFINREIENSLSEYNRSKGLQGGSTIISSHKQSLNNKINRLQLHLEDYMAAKSLELFCLEGDSEAQEDLRDTWTKVRNIMDARNLDYYKLEESYFTSEGGGVSNIDTFMKRTTVRSVPHMDVSLIDCEKLTQGQLDMKLRGAEVIQAILSIFGRVDKTLEVPKLVLIMPDTEGEGTSLHVLCACDGSVACSFPFDDIHRNKVTKVLTCVSATARFVETASTCVPNLYSGLSEYPGKLVRMMKDVAESLGAQDSLAVTTNDYSYVKDWLKDEERMRSIKKIMCLVKDPEGRIQWIKKSNREVWKAIGGKLLTPSAINAMIKLQSMRESDYAGFLEKRGGGSSAFGSKAFKRRYWILKNNTMMYYNADSNDWKTKVEKGMLSLNGATVTLLADGRTFMISYTSLPNSRVWYLRASNRVERQEWERALADTGVIEDFKESADDEVALLGAGGGTTACCVIT